MIKCMGYQIYAHPILLATILSQCKVENYKKMGLIETLKEIKQKRGWKGMYSGLFPRMVSISFSHFADSSMFYALNKIIQNAYEMFRTLFFEMITKFVDKENNLQLDNPNNNNQQNNQNFDFNPEKLRNFFFWIFVLMFLPLFKFLVKQPLEVISSNVIVQLFQKTDSSLAKRNFLSQFFYVIAKIYKEKGIRGFYAGTMTSFWANFYYYLFLMVPIPFFGSSLKIQKIINLFIRQMLHFSFYSTKLRMITSPFQSVLSVKGSHASYNHIWREEGFSSFFSGLDKYLFFIPLVLFKYFASKDSKSNNENDQQN
jgi:hypothetical protein